MARRATLLLVPALLLGLAAGCYRVRSSSGGGQQARITMPREVDLADIVLPRGYRIEAVAQRLTFPTGVTFDAQGRVFVVESGYSYGEAWDTPRLLRIEPDGQTTVIAQGGRNGPWNGVTFHNGAFYVAEGGHLEGGRVLRITPEGQAAALVENLPSMGDHHTNGPVAGPDGMIYFAQGTATNSGVVGEDNAAFGWLKRRPDFHDVPCQDVTLAGHNYASTDPLGLEPAGGRGQMLTGAFVPFGTETREGQVIRGRVPCNGAVLRIPAEGGMPELVAWGFRNPFGLAFDPDGRLYATDNGYDDRGSRPVWGMGDLLWQVQSGAWHGWPDYSGQIPVTIDAARPPGKPQPRALLATHPDKPPAPAAILGVHASANGFDFSRNPEFGHQGQAFIALFGDMAPAVGKVMRPVGFKVVRVDVTTGVVNDFAVNRGRTGGPATWVGSRGLERPVAARFDPGGTSLYVVDFGIMSVGREGPLPQRETGVLWRITREGRR